MDKISNAIKCVNCISVLNSPVILPCGHSVCKHHTQPDPQDIFNLLNQNKITCGKCLKEQMIPSEGFPQNESLMEMLAAQVHKIDLGKMHQKAKQDCESFELLIIKVNSILEDPVNLTYEEIDSIRNTVFLKREELKLKIDKETDKLITKIDKYMDQMSKLTKGDRFKILDDQNKREKLNLNKTKNMLNQIKFDNNYWKKISQEIELEHRSLLQNMENLKKSSIFNGIYELKNESEFFRNLDIDFNYISGSHQMDSKIIDPNCLKYNLMRLCEFPFCQKWKLLYRGSDYGFNWSQFHEKCDNKSATLTIVKDSNGMIFGGYTESEWSDPYLKLTKSQKFQVQQDTDKTYQLYGKFKYDCRYKSDPNAFLFILGDLFNYQKPLKAKVTEPKDAIYCDQNDGPSFGKFDFAIHGNLNYRLYSTGLKNEDCYLDIGNTYIISENQQRDFNILIKFFSFLRYFKLLNKELK